RPMSTASGASPLASLAEERTHPLKALVAGQTAAFGTAMEAEISRLKSELSQCQGDLVRMELEAAAARRELTSGLQSAAESLGREEERMEQRIESGFPRHGEQSAEWASALDDLRASQAELASRLGEERADRVAGDAGWRESFAALDRRVQELAV